MKTQSIIYYDKEVQLEGYCAMDSSSLKKPAILIAHDWSGRNEFANKKAEKIAELGYIGFAVDMYGKGKLGNTKEEKMALMKPLIEDRTLLANRILAAFNEVKKIPNVDPQRIGAIGFCFGGGCVLDLARSGADVKVVVSFHGLLSPPPHAHNKKILAKILALHGYLDPMVTSGEVLAFEKEMHEAQVDWQLIVYGSALHAFSNPSANDYQLGTVYNEAADKRSWIAMKNFFSEIF